MENEKWRPIAGYENIYSVSADGEVFSHRSNKVLKPNTDKYGYLYYILCVGGIRKTVKAHRLVAETYIPNELKLPQVNHKDENKENNTVENLEWCDSYTNNNYGTRNKRIGISQKNLPAFSKKVFCVETQTIYPSAHEAFRSTGINRGNITSCCRGDKKHNTAGGLHWKYHFPEVEL